MTAPRPPRNLTTRLKDLRASRRCAFAGAVDGPVTYEIHENALQWHSMEPRQGQVDYSVVDAMLAWTRQHEIPLRGHNVFWGIPNRVQPWQKSMDDGTLRRTLEARARDIARRYRGQFAEYDLNNEMLRVDSGFLAVSARLVAHARRRGVPGPGVQGMVDELARTGGCERPV